MISSCFTEAYGACDLNEYKQKSFTIAFGMQDPPIIARDQWEYVFKQFNQAQNYIDQSKMNEACKILDDLIIKYNLSLVK